MMPGGFEPASAVHTIRLRGPWLLTTLDSADGRPLPAPVKLVMPADWSAAFGADFRGTVRHARVFHAPTNLEAGQGVWLVVEPSRGSLNVCLNGRPLATSPGRYPIRDSLQPSNLLEVDVSYPLGCEPGGLTGEVRLEIATTRPAPSE